MDVATSALPAAAVRWPTRRRAPARRRGDAAPSASEVERRPCRQSRPGLCGLASHTHAAAHCGDFFLPASSASIRAMQLAELAEPRPCAARHARHSSGVHFLFITVLLVGPPRRPCHHDAWKTEAARCPLWPAARARRLAGTTSEGQGPEAERRRRCASQRASGGRPAHQARANPLRPPFRTSPASGPLRS